MNKLDMNTLLDYLESDLMDCWLTVESALKVLDTYNSDHNETSLKDLVRSYQ